MCVEKPEEGQQEGTTGCGFLDVQEVVRGQRAKGNQPDTVAGMNTRSELVEITTIVLLSCRATTLKELEQWCEELVRYGVNRNAEVIDGGHVMLHDWPRVGPINLSARRTIVDDVHVFIAKARAAGAKDDDRLNNAVEALCVELQYDGLPPAPG